MSLRLWLPLDGTTDNKGITGTVLSGSPASWGNGPISKCATFNNNTANVIYNTTNVYNYINEPFSWCMWLKKDYSSITANAMYAFTVRRRLSGMTIMTKRESALKPHSWCCMRTASSTASRRKKLRP